MARASFDFERLDPDRVELWRRRHEQDDAPLRLGPGDDRYEGGDRADRIHGEGGNDFLEGFGGADRLYGGPGADRITGGADADHIFGGGGRDNINAGRGDDVVTGGLGADVIGLGKDAVSDRVVLTQIADSLPGAAHDFIYRFETGVDRIDLRLIDADTATDADDAFRWIGDRAFHGVAGELRFDVSAGLLQGDVNGDGAADFEVYFRRGDGPIHEADVIL